MVDFIFLDVQIDSSINEGPNFKNDMRVTRVAALVSLLLFYVLRVLSLVFFVSYHTSM